MREFITADIYFLGVMPFLFIQTKFILFSSKQILNAEFLAKGNIS